MKDEIAYVIQLATGKYWRGRGRFRGPVTWVYEATLYKRQEDAHQAALKGRPGCDWVIRPLPLRPGAVLVSVVHHPADKVQAAPQLKAVPGPR